MFTGRYFKGAAIAAASLVGVLYPVPALIAAADSVKIEVTGAIRPSCSCSSDVHTVNLDDITKAGSAKFSFTVDCNAPFQYSMLSEHGELRLEGEPAKARNNAQAPYDLHIRIPLTHGGQINDFCSSMAIKHGAVSCRFSDSSDKIAVNQIGETEISWKQPRAALAPGQYHDRLTITVGARP